MMVLGLVALLAACSRPAVPPGDVVFVGQVLSATPEWTANEYGDALIQTVLVVRVDRMIHGQAPASPLTVVMAGGTLYGYTMAAASHPRIPAVGDAWTFRFTRQADGSLALLQER
jgi:hypothetical protein